MSTGKKYHKDKLFAKFSHTASSGVVGEVQYEVLGEVKLSIATTFTTSGTLTVQGRIKYSTAWQTVGTLTSGGDFDTFDIDAYDYIRFNFTVAAGSTGEIAASGFFKAASSGGGGAAFSTIQTDAGTNPVATGADTLTLTSSDASITITGNSTTDTIDLVSAAIGDVSKVGTPVDNQVGIWTGDGTIEGDANFTYDSTLDHLELTGEMDIHHTATSTDEHALELIVDAAGYGDVKALEVVYTTGAIAIGQDEAIILLNIDESSATGGDVIGFEVLATEGSAKVTGLGVGVGVGAVEQLSGVFTDMDSALVNATDRLTEFTTSGSDIEMFSAVSDTVTIGNSVKFEEIEFLLSTVSSKNILPTFEFSTGIGTWTTFTPIDGTNGLLNNGVIAWLDSDIPTWAVGTGSEYLIRITRNKTGAITSPIEDLVQIAEATEYYWDKNADLKINSVTSLGVSTFADPTRANSERIGASSAANSTGCTVFGKSAQSSTSGTAIGWLSNCAGTVAVSVGAASYAGTAGTSLGYNAQGGGSTVALGYAANGYNKTSCIVLGTNSKVNTNNTMVVGGASTARIITAYFGQSESSATTYDFTLSTTQGLGTDISAGDFYIKAGGGTGTGVGGHLIFQTCEAGTTGSAINSATTHLEINDIGEIIMATLPTSSAGLPTGALWNNSGVLNIA
jgi:hypothetical protein